MNRISIAFVVLLVLFAFSCTDTGETTVSPLEPEVLQSRSDYAEACQDNMRFIGSQQVIFYAMNGWYASSLEELGLSGFTCPECELEYIVEGDSKTFFVHCPLPSDPTHGSIINGEVTWPPGSGNYQSMCRANMRTIASQCVLFFAVHDRYPESLEELGMGSVTCPECENPYIFFGDSRNLYIECGLPADPNHGNIDNGITSWLSH